MITPTYFGLFAEFGESEIPLHRVCEKYFGLSASKAKKRACLHQLPIPAYRAGSQKSPWLISAADLAKHIDQQRQLATDQCANMN
jgi:hypothetical protein